MAESPPRNGRSSTSKRRAAVQPGAGKTPVGRPAKPRIRITRQTESAFFSRGLVLSILLISALIAAGLHAAGQRPDPHFVSATKMLNDYERGRDEEARNYKNEVYERALSELSLVDPESVSFGEAHALRGDVVKRREAFFVKVRAAENNKSTRRKAKAERRAVLATHQARSRMHPQVEYPECDE